MEAAGTLGSADGVVAEVQQSRAAMQRTAGDLELKGEAFSVRIVRDLSVEQMNARALVITDEANQIEQEADQLDAQVDAILVELRPLFEAPASMEALYRVAGSASAPRPAQTVGCGTTTNTITGCICCVIIRILTAGS